ncbi:Major facilitator superfamily domain, general substrate transporter [Beauveria brongniartii RCEF 3172]|uniref:Major facilitator superfamily domain, general substrate transporter n=1 Tax=Beauveria brongniartii RCEF 3172 TaxID=1081107 RepID=A0A162I5T6_9HYPO|nr:Major facilitator superfamily domain, general substrate transporter [Beauveria brongniartii RCEF 3172]
MIPLNPILESIICRNVFADVSGDADPRCKDALVQGELSFIRGWQSTFDVIPGLLTAMPYTLMANEYGRPRVLSLSVLGGSTGLGFVVFIVFICFFYSLFSPRLIWLGSMFTLIGGGAPVFNTMSFALLGEATNERQRSTVFFYMNATSIGSQMVASLLAFTLMRVSPWLCVFCGILLFVPANLCALFFPETPRDKAGSGLPSTAATAQPEDDMGSARGQMRRLTDALVWFVHERLFARVLLYTLLATTVGRSSQDILLQYVTRRYRWSWADAILLLSIQSFVTLLLLTIIFPAATQFLTQLLATPIQITNLYLARISILTSFVGAFVIGLSENAIFMIFGLGLSTLSYGYQVLVRSLLASVVDGHHSNVMYTTITLFESMGSIMAGPLLSASFREGMKWGEAWLGLPFLLTGVLYGSATVGLLSVGLS